MPRDVSRSIGRALWGLRRPEARMVCRWHSDARVNSSRVLSRNTDISATQSSGCQRTTPQSLGRRLWSRPAAAPMTVSPRPTSSSSGFSLTQTRLANSVSRMVSSDVVFTGNRVQIGMARGVGGGREAATPKSQRSVSLTGRASFSARPSSCRRPPGRSSQRASRKPASPPCAFRPAPRPSVRSLPCRPP